MESKQRNKLQSILLWITAMANIAMFVWCIVEMFNVGLSEKKLGFGLCSMFALTNVLGIILLLRWNKSGFWLIILSAIILATVCVCVLRINPYSTPIILGSLVFLWLILQLRKEGKSTWSQLNPGWDSKHCRHIYQIFAAAEIIIFVLTLIAFGNSHDDSIVDVQTTDDSSVLKPTKDVIKPSPVNTMDSIETELVHSDVKEITPEKASKPTKEKTSNKQDKPKEKKEPLSLYDAANYLDTHSVWDAKEMEQYPDLKGLNKKLIVSIKQGRSIIPHELCRMSKKLMLIQRLLREYKHFNIKQRHKNSKHVEIDYNGSANSISPSKMINSIKDAIELQRKLERLKNIKEAASDSIKNTAPTFGLR